MAASGVTPFIQIKDLNTTTSVCASTCSYENKARTIPVKTISFKCTRQNDGMNFFFSTFYQSAIKDYAKLDLELPEGPCPSKATHECGNKRGHLWECRCNYLNRKEHPESRQAFEDTVISRILAKVTSAEKKTFRLAMFGTGGLFGEEVLLFKLMNKLQEAKWSGTIKLVLIDREYRKSIEESVRYFGEEHAEPELLGALGGNECFKQFLDEVTAVLPTDIKVEGEIFSDADEYILKAQTDHELKYDFLIGFDIEDNSHIVQRIRAEAEKGTSDVPLVLIWIPGYGPSICEIGIDRLFATCFKA